MLVEPLQPRRRALVLATSRYKEKSLDDLPAVENDLIALAGTLGADGPCRFELTSHLDPTKNTAQRAIERIFELEAEAGDFLFLYITGHGLIYDQASLWFPFSDYDKRAHRSTALEAQWIKAVLENSRARQQLVIVDSCYSGLFVNSKGFGAVSEEKVREVMAGEGALVSESRPDSSCQYFIFACGDELAYLENGRSKKAMSFLTSAFVASVQDGSADYDGDGRIDADDLWKTIDDRSRQWRTQRPERHVSRGGQSKDLIVAYVNPRHGEGNHPGELERPRLRVRNPWRSRRRIFLHRHRRKLVSFATIIGLACVSVLARTLVLHTGGQVPLRPTPIVLTPESWTPIDTRGLARFSKGKRTMRIAVPFRELQWYGYFYDPPRGVCDYHLTLEARHTRKGKAPANTGWGYGVSVRSVWDTKVRAMSGWSVQDEFVMSKVLRGNVRVTQLENANTVPYYPVNLLPDTGWHFWSLDVRGQTVSVVRDKARIGEFPVAHACGGIFLRVWGEAVEFRNFRLVTY